MAEGRLKDLCFKCGQQGHWAQDCPSNNPTTRASSPLDIQSLPVLRCHCGVACTIYVSRSATNNGRKYYSRNCKCDDNDPKGRSFYKWCDAVKAPMCSCGAGACTVNIRRDEYGKDSKYYTCRIKTGHGACGFLQFDRPQSSPNSWPRSKKIDKISGAMNFPNGYIFPLFDPILVTEISLIMESLSTTPCVLTDAEVPQNAFRNDSQPSADPLRSSSLETLFTAVEKGGRNSSGMGFQKDPLNHLESLEPLDKNAMLQAGKDTLYDSVSPLIECGRSLECLVESVQAISIVAGMEATLQDNCNQAVPSISKEEILYDISSINAEAFATITDAGSYYPQSAREAASRIKEALCQIDKLETHLLKTAQVVGQSKICLQATYQELTKALKLPQEKQDQMQ